MFLFSKGLWVYEVFKLYIYRGLVFYTASQRFHNLGYKVKSDKYIYLRKITEKGVQF